MSLISLVWMKQTQLINSEWHFFEHCYKESQVLDDSKSTSSAQLSPGQDWCVHKSSLFRGLGIFVLLLTSFKNICVFFGTNSLMFYVWCSLILLIWASITFILLFLASKVSPQFFWLTFVPKNWTLLPWQEFFKIEKYLNHIQYYRKLIYGVWWCV